MNGYVVPRRQQKHYLDGELAVIRAGQELTQAKVAAQAQIALHATAQATRLRNALRVVEEFCPDAAPAAAVFVRLAEGAIVGHILERKEDYFLGDLADMYQRGDETVRTILNRAIFTRFMIDGKKVVRTEMHEPFHTLNKTYERRQARRYLRTTVALTTDLGELLAPELDELESLWHGREVGVGPWAGTPLVKCPTLTLEDGALVELSLTDLLDLALGTKGSSKPVMVGTAGFEPATPRL